MAAGLTLDSGALIAVEKNDRRTWTLLKEAATRVVPVTVPTVVIAQVWRGNSARLSRVLQGCEDQILFAHEAGRVGELLAMSRTSDVVDAIVVLGAITRRDSIVTSDPKDIDHLITAYCRINGPEFVVSHGGGNLLVPVRKLVRVLTV
jgi:hypothetical protein